jgi:hypothetical protein
MKNRPFRRPALLLLILLMSPFFMAFDTAPEESIEGTWVRKGDNLRIEIVKDHALIVVEGNEKFPCEVSDLFIYKDIRQVKRNHWNCRFLVVTMGSCRTEYQDGELFISKTGELVIICPGFASKVYSKARPRYESE